MNEPFPNKKYGSETLLLGSKQWYTLQGIAKIWNKSAKYSLQVLERWMDAKSFYFSMQIKDQVRKDPLKIVELHFLTQHCCLTLLGYCCGFYTQNSNQNLNLALITSLRVCIIPVSNGYMKTDGCM